MKTFKVGDVVEVEDARGELLRRRALTDVVDGRDFEIVWVCRVEEWAAAQKEGREPDKVPWPAEDVHPLRAEPD